MHLLISGICGFVGSSLAVWLKENVSDIQISGLDNFIRPGSELNRAKLTKLGIKIYHADIRNTSDLEILPSVDWVIDAAANPSVLAGLGETSSSRQLIEHNLFGTLNLLEICKKFNAGFILLSTSRVYSIPRIADLEMSVHQDAFIPTDRQAFPAGISSQGISENYSTQAPVSLYGATKIASETMALEYGATFDFPVWINRCGVLAGAGQFGRPDQGIFAFWIHSWREQRALKYIGFNGSGHQVRDCLHPDDLAEMIRLQLSAGQDKSKQPTVNLSGGTANSISLKQLSSWCMQRFGSNTVSSIPEERRFDIPWMVLDSSLAKQQWNWSPKRSTDSILEELASYAEQSPDWIQASAQY